MYDTVKMMKALGDENRMMIFKTLTKGETCACKLLEKLNIAQPTLSRHMRVLVDSGLVTVRKDAQWMRYSLNMDAVNELNTFFKGILLEQVPVVSNCSCKS